MSPPDPLPSPSIPKIDITLPLSSQGRHVRSPSRDKDNKPLASPFDIRPNSAVTRRMSVSSTPQSAVVLPEGVAERILDHAGLVGAGIVVGTVILGTLYAHHRFTALDTSLLSHLPERTHFFARKSNWVNQRFVKLCWLWTSLAYLGHLLVYPSHLFPPARARAPSSSIGRGPNARGRVGIPPPGPSPARSLWRRESRRSRFVAWMIGTACWLGFTSWFFGAGLGDRVIQLSGGSCAIALPREWALDRGDLHELLPSGFDTLLTTPSSELGDEQWYLPIDSSFCIDRRPLTQQTHPQLWDLVRSKSSAEITKTHLHATSSHPPLVLPQPRWHRGFDISGHVFLLTLASMLLVRELTPSWRRALRKWRENAAGRKAELGNGSGTTVGEDAVLDDGGDGVGDDVGVSVGVGVRSGIGGMSRMSRGMTTLGGTALLGLWVWMLLMTSVWFHNPPEKLTGLVVGLAASSLIDLLASSPHSPLAVTLSSNPTPNSAPNRAPNPSPTNYKHNPNPRSDPNGDPGHRLVASLSRAAAPGSPRASRRPGLASVGEDENAARRGKVIDDGIIKPTPLPSPIPSPSLDDVVQHAMGQDGYGLGREKVE